MQSDRVGPFACDRKKCAVHISIIINHFRRLRPLRQRPCRSVDFVPEFIPDLRQIPLAAGVPHFRSHNGKAALGTGFELFQLSHFLDRIFHTVGDFFGNLLRRGAGIPGDDLCLLDREFGVFEPGQLETGGNAAGKHQERRTPGGQGMADGPFCQVHNGSPVRERVECSMSGQTVSP